MIKNLLISCLFFLLGHVMVWFQLNGQFIWKGWKDNLLLVSLIGIPTSIFFIWATKWGVGQLLMVYFGHLDLLVLL